MTAHKISEAAALAGFTPSALRFHESVRLPVEEIRDLVAVWDAGVCAPVQHGLAANIASRRERVQARIAEPDPDLAADVAVRQSPGQSRQRLLVQDRGSR